MHHRILLVALMACTGTGDDLEPTVVTDTDTDADTDADADADADADTDTDTDTDADSDTDTGTSAWVDPPTRERPYTVSTLDILNPERGFYRYLSLQTDRDYSWVRDGGQTLAFSYVMLDDYRERDIDAALLDDATEGFAEARAAGIKIVLRFAYNQGPYPVAEPDASKDWMLTHIGQIQPLLVANADVIAVVQAGFIGAWGEWHTSTNGLLDDPQDKFDVLEALVDAVPVDRFVQLRNPQHKEEGYAGPIDSTVAWSGTYAARVGHHNDCYLASDTDFGTYPSNDIEGTKDFVAAETLYTPMGGETCAVNPPRSECGSALAESERLHVTYLNRDYHPGVVSSWTAGGCRETLDQSLGYRLALTTAAFPDEAPPGSVFPLEFTLSNTGFAAPINPRPVQLKLVGPDTVTASMSVDPRSFVPGDHALSGRFSLPTTLAEGTYDVVLALPDAAPTLATDPRYAIQLANDGTWDGAHNVLGTVEISAGAVGSVGAYVGFEEL